MAEAEFFDDESRERVKEVVGAIEADSAAEVVVAMRERSWRYRHAHFLFGFIVALAILCALLFLPQPFDILYWPLELTGSFVLGAAFCMNVPFVERVFATRRVMNEQVNRAAKTAFVDLGVSLTRGRTGLLVYVSLVEKRVELVSDAGLDKTLTNRAYQKAKAAMEAAVQDADFAAFVVGMRALAAPLAEVVPREASDVNELADEVA